MFPPGIRATPRRQCGSFLWLGWASTFPRILDSSAAESSAFGGKEVRAEPRKLLLHIDDPGECREGVTVAGKAGLGSARRARCVPSHIFPLLHRLKSRHFS